MKVASIVMYYNVSNHFAHERPFNQRALLEPYFLEETTFRLRCKNRLAMMI